MAYMLICFLLAQFDFILPQQRLDAGLVYDSQMKTRHQVQSISATHINSLVLPEGISKSVNDSDIVVVGAECNAQLGTHQRRSGKSEADFPLQGVELIIKIV